MQVRHEENIELEEQQQLTNSKLEILRSFKNEEDVHSVSEPKAIAKAPSKSKSKTKSKKTKLRAAKPRAKNTSMNSLVRSNYADNLSYFSGDQTKIDDFLRGIKNTGDLNKLRRDASSLYSKEEWTYILRNIKMKFPDLSKGRKMNLKAITSRINGMKKTDPGTGLWSQASRSCSMTEEDIKWLYDLDEDQMSGSFIEEEFCEDSQDERKYVLTLSQNDPAGLVGTDTEYEEVEATDDDELLVFDDLRQLGFNLDHNSDIISDSEFENDDIFLHRTTNFTT